MKKLLKWIGIIVGAFVALIIIIVVIIIYQHYAESKKTKTRYENATQSQKNCVDAIKEDIYGSPPLKGKLNKCNVPK